jgi:uncharacterized protein YecT (DUF1311 family)
MMKIDEWLKISTIAVIVVAPFDARSDDSIEAVKEEAPYGASDAEIKEALQDCSKNEISIALCAWQRFQESDKRLQSTIEEVATILRSRSPDEVSPDQFVAAQEQWKLFRNATCNFDSSFSGSMAFSVRYGCRARYNEDKVGSLTSYMNCYLKESCEVPYLLYPYETQ